MDPNLVYSASHILTTQEFLRAQNCFPHEFLISKSRLPLPDIIFYTAQVGIDNFPPPIIST